MAKANTLMSLRDLLKASNKVKGYGAGSIAKKELGTIYTFNKVLKVKPNKSVVEVSMLIAGVTDKIGVGAYKRPVAAHRVQLRIKGIENEEVTASELVRRIRAEHPEMSDKDKYPSTDILEAVRKGKELLKGKAVFEVNRVILELVKPKRLVEHGDGTASYEELPDKWTFGIVSKEVSPDCKVQVRCSCSNYFWMFQYPNAMANVDLAGKRGAKPYGNYGKSEKKTTGNQIGICKHLTLLIGMLMHERIIDKVERGKGNPETAYSLNIEKFRSAGRLNRRAFKNLSAEYKRDLRSKIRERNDKFFDPTPRKKKNKMKAPKGTMAKVDRPKNPAASFAGAKNAKKRKRFKP